MFNKTTEHIRAKYSNLFAETKGKTNETIEKMGWYGKIIGISSNPREIRMNQKVNLYNFMDYISYHNALNKLHGT